MSQEPTVRADLYRVLTNSIKWGIFLGNYRISNVAVEYSIDGKKADLVIFRQMTNPPDSAFLVIETKARRIYPSLTLARATKQAMNYSKKLTCRYFAVYDGWNFLLFEMSSPYLIKVSNFLHMDESVARNLLYGLLEFDQNRYTAFTLNSLPKIPDGWSFHQTIMPPIAKLLASVTTPQLEDSWKILLSQWLPIIQRDGYW